MAKKRKIRRTKKSKSNNMLLIGGAAILLAVVALSQINTGPVVKVKDSNVSDIKKTKESSKPLNIPKKEKAINKKSIKNTHITFWCICFCLCVLLNVCHICVF